MLLSGNSLRGLWKTGLQKNQAGWEQLLAYAVGRIESGEMPSPALPPFREKSWMNEHAPKALTATFENASKTLLCIAVPAAVQTSSKTAWWSFWLFRRVSAVLLYRGKPLSFFLEHISLKCTCVQTCI